MNVHVLGPAMALPRPPCVLVWPREFLLLHAHRNHRLAALQESSHDQRRSSFDGLDAEEIESGVAVNWIERPMPPVVTGAVVAVIGLNLASIPIKNMASTCDHERSRRSSRRRTATGRMPPADARVSSAGPRD
jgi:hypothetical protein